VPFENASTGKHILPFDNMNTIAGVALANTESHDIDIRTVLRNDTGDIVDTAEISIPALGHTSFVLADRIKSTTLQRGSIEFDSPQPSTVYVGRSGSFVMLGLRFNPKSGFSTIPTLNADGEFDEIMCQDYCCAVCSRCANSGLDC